MKQLFDWLQKFDGAAKTAITGVAVLGAVLSIAASYLTLTASGTTSAASIIPPKEGQQARITGFTASSDLTTATAVIYQGTSAHSVQFGNTNLVTTNVIVHPTNGIVAASKVLFQSADGDQVLTVSSVSARTVTNVIAGATNTLDCLNLHLTSAPGVVQLTNQNVELLGTVATIGVGSNDYKAISGEFALNANRGGYVVVTGTTTARIDALTVKYESPTAKLDGESFPLAELTVDGVRWLVFASDEVIGKPQLL